MQSLGKIKEFSQDSNINQYIERLEQYFEANGVSVDSADLHKRRATLVSVIGAKTYDVLSDLCSLSAPSDKMYAQLATILRNHFAPKKLVIAKRYRFHSCVQREGESVSTFASSLKHLASMCNFGTHLNEALSDWFVCGLQSKEIQKKLLTEEHTFEQALKNALSTEAAEKDIAEFSQDASTPVNKLGYGNRWRPRPLNHRKPPGISQGKPNSLHHNKSISECLSCRKSGHPRAKCKYRSFTCNSCGKSGHIADACKSKSEKVHKVEDPDSPQGGCQSDLVDPFSISLYNLCAEQHGIEVPVKLNGINLLMELDTGWSLHYLWRDIQQAP